jgi:hypothetical protein
MHITDWLTWLLYLLQTENSVYYRACQDHHESTSAPFTLSTASNFGMTLNKSSVRGSGHLKEIITGAIAC